MLVFRVCVIGLGYIGLPTAATMAVHGHKVTGVDISPKAVESVNAGAAHIVEPELDQAVHRAVASGNLKAQSSPAEADVFMICVPTPFGPPENGVPMPDISFVLEAARSIAPFLKDGSVVIIESTCPVGTTEQVSALLSSLSSASIHLAYCPERVLPGKILHEVIHNSRIIGGLMPEASDRAAELYATFVKGEILKTNARTAEMAKLAENSFRDVNIAFANELSILCEEAGINPWELIGLTNLHPRVKILQPGCGVGGHCIAVDPWFLVSMNPRQARLIHSARQVNDSKPLFVVDKVVKAVQDFQAQAGRSPMIACLGLAFKPDVDDFRESPALAIWTALNERGLSPVAVEPFANGSVSHVPLVDLAEALDKADILVGLVKHTLFAKIESPKLIDFCGLSQ